MKLVVAVAESPSVDAALDRIGAKRDFSDFVAASNARTKTGWAHEHSRFSR